MATHAEKRELGPSPAIETAAWTVLETGLSTGASAFANDLVTWTPQVASELASRLSADVDEPADHDVQRSPMMAKLRQQLQGADEKVVVLAAELLFIQQLPLSTVTSNLKRARINDVLSFASNSGSIPAQLNEALGEKGPITGGLGFNVQVREHAKWLCDFICHWDTLDDDTKNEALSDPRAFHAVAASTPSDWRSIRYSLQYLAWPNYFQPIVKHEHKTRIRDAFADHIGGASGNDEADIDHDLHEIAGKLSEGGEPVWWYQGSIAKHWQRYSPDSSRRAWLIRPGKGGVNTAASWRKQNRVALAATHLPRIPTNASRMEVSHAIEQGYPHSDYQSRFQLTSDVFTFLSRMHPQDVIGIIQDGQLCLATLTDEVGFVEDSGQHLERSVHWVGHDIALEDLESPLKELVAEPGTIVDLTDGLDMLLARMFPGQGMAAGESVVDAPPSSSVPALPEVSEDLAESLHMPQESLQEIVDTLQSRQQVVFYGPPGTGKTYLAQELARFLAGADDPSRVQLVQFHPSYAYEDFFEGYRPTLTESGQPGFTLQAGPLRRQAVSAASESGREHAYFLIIDEMNRADLARVFGELYFLLEYRDRTVLPQYSPHASFRLPKNLFIIGTMNTSDRSIAMVDAAIRRRFAFMELHPDEQPVRGVLRATLEAAGKDTWVADVHDALNAAMDESDRDLKIGPSYFMKPEAETTEGLARIWKYDLLPLLEEHYYGRLTRAEVHQRFGLDTLLRSVNSK